MSKESLTHDGDDGLYKAGDSIEKLQRLALQAVKEGSKDGDTLYISIPVDENMSYFGTGIWHFTEEGRMVRANDLFSETLSAALESNVRVFGYMSKSNPETGLLDCRITATVTY